MRDPNRIDPFLEELGKLWKKNFPDWRFTQFIINVFGNRDLFYMEENEFLVEVKKYIESMKKGN